MPKAKKSKSNIKTGNTDLSVTEYLDVLAQAYIDESICTKGTKARARAEQWLNYKLGGVNDINKLGKDDMKKAVDLLKNHPYVQNALSED